MTLEPRTYRRKMKAAFLFATFVLRVVLLSDSCSGGRHEARWLTATGGRGGYCNGRRDRSDLQCRNARDGFSCVKNCLAPDCSEARCCGGCCKRGRVLRRIASRFCPSILGKLRAGAASPRRMSPRVINDTPTNTAANTAANLISFS